MQLICTHFCHTRAVLQVVQMISFQYANRCFRVGLHHYEQNVGAKEACAPIPIMINETETAIVNLHLCACVGIYTFL